MSYRTCKEVGPLCPVEATTYGYYPNFGGNVFFTVFYGVLGLAQLGIGVYFRAWTLMVALVVGGFLEMAGYIGRILMHHNPWDEDAFKLQIVCLVLAPTFVAAGIYLTLKHIILSLGPEHSRLQPRLFTWIFIGCDIGSLILQAAGGGVAAAAGNTNVKLLNAGNNIIIAGIAFQVGHHVGVRPAGAGVLRARDSPRARIPEMAGGWGNPLMQKEDEFLVLDGMMIALALLALTVCHPGFFLRSLRKVKSKS
ncbi:conserved hypothetical protein [Aspergillus terreus NIH2624]|uniref:RTA1 domain protein n=1 Tax=Aspergillus terreus (strain NIH 2624 / FGSC A1156) TaxID=341663 RepID=Q0CZF9_ASPTN|nr:uncharacterized protein ATEG_00925 [Aspergillus terreus NIH2624]EAU39571.1 conserved hypothetical protein [Aspergillus terreus NIH2624]